MANIPSMTRQGSMPPPVVPQTINQPPPPTQTQLDSNIQKEDIPENLLNKMKVKIVDIIDDYANSSFQIEVSDIILAVSMQKLIFTFIF